MKSQAQKVLKPVYRATLLLSACGLIINVIVGALILIGMTQPTTHIFGIITAKPTALNIIIIYGISAAFFFICSALCVKGLKTSPAPKTKGSAATSWTRLGAFAIDLGLVCLLIVALHNLGYVSFSTEEVAPSMSSARYALYQVAFLYFSIMTAIFSTTIGKRIFRLRIVRTNNSEIGVGRAMARSSCYMISFIMPLIFLVIAFTKDKRGLHDLICDTKVVKIPAGHGIDARAP